MPIIKKAKKKLGWSPRVTFKELVRIMVDADLECAALKAPGEGKLFWLSMGLPPLIRRYQIQYLETTNEQTR